VFGTESVGATFYVTAAGAKRALAFVTQTTKRNLDATHAAPSARAAVLSREYAIANVLFTWGSSKRGTPTALSTRVRVHVEQCLV